MVDQKSKIIYGKMTASNTILLVIDVVNGCCHRKCEDKEERITFSKIRKMVPKLDSFIDQYRKKIGGSIYFAKIAPWQEKFLAKNINELYLNDPKACYYSDDASGFSEEFYLVKPKKSDFVFTKNHYDCFASADFLKELKKRKIRYVVITGVFTDGCVLATIISGFSRGFNFVVLKDLIETTDAKTRQDLQKILVKWTFPVMYGKTITSKDFLGVWQKRK